LQRGTVNKAAYYKRHLYVNTIAKIRYRCKLRGIQWEMDNPAVSLNLRQRFDRGVCELSGVRLKMEAGKLTWNSPSLDRKDPARGYVPGNVRIIAHALNAALGNWGEGSLAILMHGWLGQQQIEDEEKDRHDNAG
jgi:hypothetical protein